ncbi:hypothetical protein BDY19DRAFT_999048 [Irpex rosettiformis]|uniref:Uncharacterized protein n=1 Tax=Irpex rosettiformis TaxID=378272 RepID=A0ACB8TLT7_9APHY|nr:hypothetical protein BDY19DRAFT_999048 [Irpex rosettiformis]
MPQQRPGQTDTPVASDVKASSQPMLASKSNSTQLSASPSKTLASIRVDPNDCMLTGANRPPGDLPCNVPSQYRLDWLKSLFSNNPRWAALVEYVSETPEDAPHPADVAGSMCSGKGLLWDWDWKYTRLPMDFHIATTETYLRALDYVQNVSLVCAGNRMDKEDILLRIGLAFRDVSRGAFANEDPEDDPYAPSKLTMANYDTWDAAITNHAQAVATAIENMLSESVNLDTGSRLQAQQLAGGSPVGNKALISCNDVSQEQPSLNKSDNDPSMDVDEAQPESDSAAPGTGESAPQLALSAISSFKLPEKVPPVQAVAEPIVAHSTSSNTDVRTELSSSAELNPGTDKALNSTHTRKSGRKRKVDTTDEDGPPQVELVIQTRRQRRNAENAAGTTNAAGSTHGGAVGAARGGAGRGGAGRGKAGRGGSPRGGGGGSTRRVAHSGPSQQRSSRAR